ncbi:MAG: rRNA maturation RNase YbeY [Candidatus Magasanikbacteria bacterium CG10_big_fil_rev_8_21_14_0_10_40_10]|uniref:Endoribonuclease YbeY n=1 Tax=Candidatus Magasanikbacteria bacterium CG10_big_fil_rev_8_21_14_0_10_40_10 TaxID=1974648 RepID=A0A2M6W3A9_9BACT|nr:MAG: rRNA maturation RNase YbeY [Candidatus Magasanikbacteria bacterium CG10_big_fil_rev_8_21_14_0_10_40_10]
MIKTELFKTVSCPIKNSEIIKIAKQTAKQEPKLSGRVEIKVIGEEEMKELNRQYRRIDQPTDVLSFAWQEDKIIPSALLGQIYICYPVVLAQAQDSQTSVNKEFSLILIHGLLHLVGYDHYDKKTKNIMFTLQEKIQQSL